MTLDVGALVKTHTHGLQRQPLHGVRPELCSGASWTDWADLQGLNDQSSQMLPNIN